MNWIIRLTIFPYTVFVQIWRQVVISSTSSVLVNIGVRGILLGLWELLTSADTGA